MFPNVPCPSRGLPPEGPIAHMIARSVFALLVWVKSTKSAEGNCVEVAIAAPRCVIVRDSKNAQFDYPVLVFSTEQWADFVGDVRAGLLDGPKL
jgi:hypothetical protein